MKHGQTGLYFDDNLHVCTHCKIDKGTPEEFRIENNMDSGLVPPELSGLTQCEEVLIARAFPVMQVYVIMYMQEKDIIQFHPKDIH